MFMLSLCLKSRQTVLMVATGVSHAVLLRTDGQAVAFGIDPYHRGYLDIPPLPEGLRYTQVAVGIRHTVLVRSDGQAIACGRMDCHWARK